MSVVELARRLLALESALDPELARRLVAPVLGRPPASLPESLAAHQLRPASDAAVAEVPLRAAEFAVVDLETTGLSSRRSAILEIGAVHVARLRCVDRFATLVRPPERVPPRISALTGIVDAMVVDAPTAPRALRRFRRWLGRVSAGPFVAHNARFDAGFVGLGLERHGLPAYPVPVLCTARLARRVLPRLGRYNLDHLCAHFGIANPARHRALGDAESTAQALIAMIEIALAERDVATVGDLLDLQERPLKRRRRRRRPVS